MFSAVKQSTQPIFIVKTESNCDENKPLLKTKSASGQANQQKSACPLIILRCECAPFSEPTFLALAQLEIRESAMF